MDPRVERIKDNYSDPTRCWKTYTIWIYGQDENLKKQLVDEQISLNKVYINYGSKYFKGYNKHEQVYFPDFNGKIPILELKNITDWAPYTVPIDNRNKKDFVAKLIVITSKKYFKEYYKVKDKYDQSDIDGLTWRIDKLIQVENGNCIIEKENGQ